MRTISQRTREKLSKAVGNVRQAEQAFSRPIEVQEKATSELRTFFVALKELVKIGADIQAEMEAGLSHEKEALLSLHDSIDDIADAVTLLRGQRVFLLDPKELGSTINELDADVLRKAGRHIEPEVREKLINILKGVDS